MIIPNMGTKPTIPTPLTGLASVLFTPVQQRVLGLLFGQPDRRFQGAEVIRLADSGTGAVHRFLTRLSDSELVTIERIGNQKHYQANRASPIFKELQGLISKTSGLVIPLRSALLELSSRMTAAFIYGSIAKGSDKARSDIDIMVIADHLDYADLFAALQPVEKQLGRAISPSVMTLEEWRRKRKGAGFASRIGNESRLFVIGSADDID